MAQNNYMTAPKPIFIGTKGAAANQRDVKKVKEFRAYARRGDLLRLTASCQVQKLKTERGNVLERASLLPPEVELVR